MSNRSMDNYEKASQEHHIKGKLFVHISWINVHDFGKPNKYWILAIAGYGGTYISNVGNTFSIRISPSITSLILIYHENSFEL